MSCQTEKYLCLNTDFVLRVCFVRAHKDRSPLPYEDYSSRVLAACETFGWPGCPLNPSMAYLVCRSKRKDDDFWFILATLNLGRR